MNFDIYIFDLDGTLLNLGDIRSYADKILKRTLIELKTPTIPDRNKRNQFWSSIDNYIEVLNKWGVPKAHKFWKQYDKIDFKHRKILVHQKKIMLYNDVEVVLEKIYNHKDRKKIAIVTNTAYYVVDFILKKFKITPYFQEIFSMGFKNDQKYAKPSPRGILSILEKLQYDGTNNRALMIGDSPSDIKAAKKANISACLVKRGITRYGKERFIGDFQPNYTVERLDEILEI